jgi:hypothetical protein
MAKCIYELGFHSLGRKRRWWGFVVATITT